MSSHYQKAYFLLSVADVKQLPSDQGIEVAMVGRSNAGKSSVLNRITQNKALARVSKTPGRTQMINIFELDKTRRLMDLPGYGYAKVPPAIQARWQKTVDAYFSDRSSLKGLVLIMDIRHPMRDLDKQLLEYCVTVELPVHIVLNKADKLNRSDTHKTLRAVETAIKEYAEAMTVQIFSALKGTGMKELYAVLDEWYEYK